jgi:hypothetical protein
VEQNIFILGLFRCSVHGLLTWKLNRFPSVPHPARNRDSAYIFTAKGTPMEDKTGKLRNGSADREKYEDGMLIRFDGDLAGWSGMDMLSVGTPSGKSLSLQPEATEGDRLYVMAFIQPAMHLRFWLAPVDANTARLGMEDHHVRLVADYYATAAK